MSAKPLMRRKIQQPKRARTEKGPKMLKAFWRYRPGGNLSAALRQRYHVGR